jgi:hypothetical protein
MVKYIQKIKWGDGLVGLKKRKRNRYSSSWLTFLIIVIACVIMLNQGSYFQLIGFICLSTYVPFKLLRIFPEKPKYLSDEFPEEKNKNKRL